METIERADSFASDINLQSARKGGRPRGPRIQKMCESCNSPFTVTPGRAIAKYCSTRCSTEGRRCDVESRMAQFWTYVDRRGPDECWPWKGNIRSGYGRFPCNRKLLSAHCVAHELTYGPINAPRGTTGKVIMHTCDNRACCNPAHLELGTQALNAHDMKKKGRSTLGRNVGEVNKAAKLTEDQVRKIRTDNRSQRILAKEYGVSKPLIRYIKNRKIWKHVE